MQREQLWMQPSRHKGASDAVRSVFSSQPCANHQSSASTTSAQAALAGSSEYMDMLAAVIKSEGGNQLSSAGVKALIPSDWRKLIGKHLHASMTEWQCKPRGIELSYLSRPDGFPVFMYQAKEGAQQG